MTRNDVQEQFGAAPDDEGPSDRMADEIVRLRKQLRDTHTKVFHLEEKLTWVERERDQLTSLPAERILWALVNPSPTVLHAMASTFDVSKSLHLAIKTASQEVAGDR